MHAPADGIICEIDGFKPLILQFSIILFDNLFTLSTVVSTTTLPPQPPPDNLAPKAPSFFAQSTIINFQNLLDDCF